MVNRIDLENRVIPFRILLETLENSYDLLESSLLNRSLPSFKFGLKYLAKYIQDFIEKAGDGLPIVGHHFAFLPENISCFDIVPVCLEGVSYLLTALLPDGAEKYYDLIQNYGHPFHTCSSQKGIMGMTLDKLFQFDAIIAPTGPCDNTYASYPYFKYQENIPLVLPDLPFKHEEKSYHYYGQQIKQSLIDLGKIIGQEPDWEKLKKSIELDNEAIEIDQELFELRKAIPCPVENMYNIMKMGLTAFMSGTQEKKDFFSKMLAVSKENYRHKRRHGGGEEKIRSIWPYMLIFFDLALCEWLERDIGMSVLFDIFNYSFTDPIDTKSDLDTLFYGMAKKSFGFPMMKQSTDFYYSFLDDCVRLAKEYKADCFIFTAHIGCKQFGSVHQLLREALRDEVGIPLLVIEVDVGDKRMTNFKVIKDKINIFAQTLL